MQAAPPGKLYSKGPLPWRLLAYLLKISPEVSRVRNVIRKRLMDEPRIAASEKTLDRMLLTLAERGFVTLDPPPPPPPDENNPVVAHPVVARSPDRATAPDRRSPQSSGKAVETFGRGEWHGRETVPQQGGPPPSEPYRAVRATPTPKLDILLVFRSVHPLYGAFLVEQLGIADRNERLQALESVLEVPRPLLRPVRVPLPDELPPGPLAQTRLDAELIRRGLILAPLPPPEDDEEEDDDEP